MTPPAFARRTLRWAPVVALLAVVLVRPAGAATATVTLNSNGPTPQTLTINRGDKVTFVNQDTGSHTISSNAGAWTYHATIAAGASATTPAFAAAGNFGYRDSFFIAVVQQNVNGTITVKATTPSPTPKPTTTKSPTPSPKPTTTTSPTRTATATPTATASGLAIGPGIGGLPTPAVTTGPTPNVAPLETPSASGTPVAVAYGAKSEIVQSSAHRYGLPVLLALLAAVGVLSLLVRLLLSEAPAGRRTAEEGSQARD